MISSPPPRDSSGPPVRVSPNVTVSSGAPPARRSREIRALEGLAHLLDEAIPIPGTKWRFGLDFILGLIPGAGDVIAAAMGAAIVLAAVRAQVPGVVVARMALLVIGDALLGLIPFAGDVADLFLKSNRRNLETLKRHAGGTRRAGFADYAIVGGVLLGFLLAIVGIFALAIWLAGRIAAAF